MTSSKEFKQAVREGKLKEALAIAMENVPELHITTWIASADDSSHPNERECLRTHINLVEGEIVNEIDERLLGDRSLPGLQQFHLQQVTRGHQTVSQNIQSLQQIFRLLSVLQKQRQGLAYTPVNTWTIDESAVLPAATPQPSVDSNYLTAQSSPQITGAAEQKENTGFVLVKESDDLASEEDEADIVNELLSLDEIDVEVEQPKEEQNRQNIKNKAKDDEDWGDWLEEDERESNSDIIDLDDLDIEQSEDWDEE